MSVTCSLWWWSHRSTARMTWNYTAMPRKGLVLAKPALVNILRLRCLGTGDSTTEGNQHQESRRAKKCSCQRAIQTAQSHKYYKHTVTHHISVGSESKSLSQQKMSSKTFCGKECAGKCFQTHWPHSSSWYKHDGTHSWANAAHVNSLSNAKLLLGPTPGQMLPTSVRYPTQSFSCGLSQQHGSWLGHKEDSFLDSFASIAL